MDAAALDRWGPLFPLTFVGGEWGEQSGFGWFDVVSPSTQEVVARVPAGSAADIDRAVAAARTSFESGIWSSASIDDRVAVMRRASEAIAESQEDLARLITSEVGTPISLSRSTQVAIPRRLLDTMIDLAADYPFASVRSSATGSSMVLREPVGVVAAILPWNAPLMVAIIKLAPALLAGCSVVLKPAPQAPLNVYALAKILEDAGLPAGVLNVVAADREVSEYLVGHPDVDKVTFTGSTAAGRRIAALCGNDLRRVTLELGGKSAAVLLDDADLDTAVQALRLGSFRNTGQVCSLKTRIVVSQRRHQEFLDRMVEMVEWMPLGDPHQDVTELGPLVSAEQRERVEGYIARGRAEGARLVTGGERPQGLDRGWYVEPTIFTDVTPGMAIAQEEIFGPVLSVLTYRDEDEAISIANDSRYGLNGAVFTGDLDRGLAVARRMRTGTVEVNGSPIGFQSPVGGFKDSGIGREAGPEGFDAYVEVKSVGLPASFAEQLALP